jgi:hypothetical protein
MSPKNKNTEGKIVFMFYRIYDGRTHVRTPPTFRGKSETADVRVKKRERESEKADKTKKNEHTAINARML